MSFDSWQIEKAVEKISGQNWVNQLHLSNMK